MKRYFYAIIIAVIVGLFSCVSFAEDFEMHGKGDSDLPEIEFNLVPPPPVVPEEKIETPEDPQSPPVVEEQEEQLVPPPPTVEEEEAEIEIIEEEEEVPPPTLTSSTFIVVENNEDPEETPDEPLGRVIPPVKITTVTKTVKTGASICEQAKTADPNADVVLALESLIFEDAGRTVIPQKQKSSVNRLFVEEKEVIKHNFAKTGKTVLRI